MLLLPLDGKTINLEKGFVSPKWGRSITIHKPNAVLEREKKTEFHQIHSALTEVAARLAASQDAIEEQGEVEIEWMTGRETRKVQTNPQSEVKIIHWRSILVDI